MGVGGDVLVVLEEVMLSQLKLNYVAGVLGL